MSQLAVDYRKVKQERLGMEGVRVSLGAKVEGDARFRGNESAGWVRERERQRQRQREKSCHSGGAGWRLVDINFNCHFIKAPREVTRNLSLSSL